MKRGRKEKKKGQKKEEWMNVNYYQLTMNVKGRDSTDLNFFGCSRACVFPFIKHFDGMFKALLKV